MTLAMTAIMIFAGRGFHHEALAASSCPSLCEGKHLWIGGTWGAKTRMSQVDMFASPGWISNMLHVRGNSGQYVETGMRSAGGEAEYYYFADITAANGYHFNYITVVPAAEIGRTLYMSIWKNPDSWSIELDSFSGSYYWAGYSTPNYMNADQIFIGQRNSSTNGFTRSTVYWRDNYWKNGSDGLWYRQYRPDPMPSDADYINSPVQAGWNTKPSASSTGGIWYARTL
jgi:hypothetical protein